MRDVYIVAYDICNPKRLRYVHKITKSFGEPLQYSVFLCRLDKKRLRKLRTQLNREIKEDEDQILIIKLGPESNLRHLSFSALGKPMIVKQRVPIIV